jgi:hypothetical protein
MQLTMAQAAVMVLLLPPTGIKYLASPEAPCFLL